MKKHPYPTLRAELEGAESGRKPLSRYSITVDGLAGREGLEYMLLAFEHDLVVTLHRRSRLPNRPFGAQPVTVFTSRPEELWRVPALLTWSRGLGLAPPHRTQGVHESLLLGYSPAQIARWYRHLDGVEQFCVYTLLSQADRARVNDLGRRCFGSAEELVGTTFFMLPNGPLKKNARNLVPKGLTLARTKCNPMLLRALLGDPEGESRRGPLVRVRVSKQQALAVNRAMRSKVQLLTATGWR